MIAAQLVYGDISQVDSYLDVTHNFNVKYESSSSAVGDISNYVLQADKREAIPLEEFNPASGAWQVILKPRAPFFPEKKKLELGEIPEDYSLGMDIDVYSPDG